MRVIKKARRGNYTRTWQSRFRCAADSKINVMRLFLKILFVVYLLGAQTIAAQEKETKLFLTGYIKNLHEISFVDNLEQLQWTTLLHNRLNFKYIPSNTITTRREFRNRMFYGDNVKIFPYFRILFLVMMVGLIFLENERE